MANKRMVKKTVVEQPKPKKINKKLQKIKDDFCKEKGCRLFCSTCDKEVINMRSILNKPDSGDLDECTHVKKIIPISVVDTYCLECQNSDLYKDKINELAKKEYNSRIK